MYKFTLNNSKVKAVEIPPQFYFRTGDIFKFTSSSR